MNTRLSMRVRRLAKVLDELTNCVLVVDQRFRVKEINSSASAFVAKIGRLRVVDRRLTCSDANDQAALSDSVRRLCGKASNGASARAVTLRGGNHLDAPLVVTISRLVFGSGVKKKSVELLLQFHANHGPKASAVALLRSMGLSQAEVRLVQALAEGLTLAEHAKQRQVSHETARTQLKSALAKSGMHRQTELVRFVLGEQ